MLAVSGVLNPMTMVRVVMMLGLMELTAVVLMVSGLGEVLVAVYKLLHAVEVMGELRRMQERGVIVVG